MKLRDTATRASKEYFIGSEESRSTFLKAQGWVERSPNSGSWTHKKRERANTLSALRQECVELLTEAFKEGISIK